MKRRMLCGYEIAAHPAVSVADISHVTIQKLGSKDVGFFTPDEAKRFAEAILKAAQQAEQDA